MNSRRISGRHFSPSEIASENPRASIHKQRRPFNSHPPHTILREVSRVSSLILRAKPLLAKKVLRHGNRFAARVRRRYFRRERSDDWKCVCCSQASTQSTFLKFFRCSRFSEFDRKMSRRTLKEQCADYAHA